MANRKSATWRCALLVLLALGTIGWLGVTLIPEMKELVNAFENRPQRAACLAKYGTPGVVPEELTFCEMSQPVITKSEQKGEVVYYTMESRVEKCKYSEAAVGTVRIFKMGWKNGKIVAFEWGGPKGGKVEY
jgi:hypothetical protein